MIITIVAWLLIGKSFALETAADFLEIDFTSRFFMDCLHL